MHIVFASMVGCHNLLLWSIVWGRAARQSYYHLSSTMRLRVAGGVSTLSWPHRDPMSSACLRAPKGKVRCIIRSWNTGWISQHGGESYEGPFFTSFATKFNKSPAMIKPKAGNAILRPLVYFFSFNNVMSTANFNRRNFESHFPVWQLLFLLKFYYPFPSICNLFRMYLFYVGCLYFILWWWAAAHDIAIQQTRNMIDPYQKRLASVEPLEARHLQWGFKIAWKWKHLEFGIYRAWDKTSFRKKNIIPGHLLRKRFLTLLIPLGAP